MSGGNCPGGNCPGGNCPDTVLSYDHNIYGYVECRDCRPVDIDCAIMKTFLVEKVCQVCQDVFDRCWKTICRESHQPIHDLQAVSYCRPVLFLHEEGRTSDTS